MIYVGIDPGITGGIAAIHEGVSGTMASVGVWPMPVAVRHFGKRKRSEIMLQTVEEILKSLGTDVTVGIEEAQSFPKMGVVGAFSYGKGYGRLLGLLETLKIRHQEIRPNIWKPYIFKGRGGTEKSDARILAAQLFPTVSLGNRKDEGIAEALLIAEYVYRTSMRVVDNVTPISDAINK